MAEKERNDLKLGIKVTVITLTVLLWLSLPLVFLFGISAAMVRHGGPRDPFITDISFSDAPEGTFYADILVEKDKLADNYTVFNAPPLTEKRISPNAEPRYTKLAITADSGISQYDEDGYVSLLSHCKNAEMTVTLNNGYTDHQRLSTRFDGNNNVCLNEFKKYKAAYVDENGNVLGVTQKLKTVYDIDSNYMMSASGNTLTYTIWDYTPRQNFLFFFAVRVAPILFVLIPIVGIILLIVKKVRKKRSIQHQ